MSLQLALNRLWCGLFGHPEPIDYSHEYHGGRGRRLAWCNRCLRPIVFNDGQWY